MIYFDFFQFESKIGSYPDPILYRHISFSGQAGKKFLRMNYLLLPTIRMTKIGLDSLGTLKNVSEYVLKVVILDVGGQYIFNMLVGFKTHL